MDSHRTGAQKLLCDAMQDDLFSHNPAVAAAKMANDRTKLDTFFDTLAVVAILVCTVSLLYICKQGLPLYYYITALAACVICRVAAFGVYSIILSARKNLDTFFNILAVLETLVCIMFAAYFCTQGFPLSNIITAISVGVASVGVTFILYSVIISLIELKFEWPADKNLNIHHDIPIPPLPAPGPEDDDIYAWLDDDSSDSNGDTVFSNTHKINLNAKRRPTSGPKYTEAYECGDNDTVDQIWTVPKAGKSCGNTLVYSTFGTVSSVTTTPQLGHAQEDDPSGSTETVHQQPVKEQIILLTRCEARPKLLVLMDQMEKEGERDGTTATAYRYRKKLKELFKAAPSGSLDAAFRDRLLKYAKVHNINKTVTLWTYGIGLAYNGTHLTNGMVTSTKDVVIWKYLQQIEENKKRALAREKHDAEIKAERERQELKHNEEVKAEREREELKQLLQDVRKYAIQFGDKKSRHKFSAACYAKWSTDITFILDQIQEARNEKKRQDEAKLEGIRDIVRNTRDVEGAKDGFLGERVNTLLPANEVEEFWLSLQRDLLAEDVAILRGCRSTRLAFFKNIGFESLTEALFNMNTAQNTSMEPSTRVGWRAYGYKFNLIDATKTYSRYKDVLGKLVGRQNARKRFNRIYDEELKQNKSAWCVLMLMVIMVVEDGREVWYIDYWHARHVAEACKKTDLPQRAFWDHLRYREAKLNERRKQIEEKLKAETAISDLAELMKNKHEQAAAGRQEKAVAKAVAVSKTQDEDRARTDAQAEIDAKAQATQAAAQAHADAALADEEQDQVEEEAASAEEDELVSMACTMLEAGVSDEEDDFPDQEPVTAEEEASLAENRAMVEAQLAGEEAAAEAFRLQAQALADAALIPLAIENAHAAAQQAVPVANTPVVLQSGAAHGCIASSSGRLIKSTQPVIVIKPQRWDENAGGFMAYWQSEASKQPTHEKHDGGVSFDLRSVNRDFRLRGIIKSLLMADASHGNAFQRLVYREPPSGRLIKSTQPNRSSMITPKPWKINAGGFESYWRRERSRHSKHVRKSTRNSGPRFRLRHAEQEIYPDRQDLTVHPLSGYLLLWRMALKDLTPTERKGLRVRGQIWPKNCDPALKYGNWKPAQDFKLPRTVDNRFRTLFWGLDVSAEKRRAEQLTTDPEAREVEEFFSDKARKAEELGTELWTVFTAASIPLPRSSDTDISLEPFAIAERDPNVWNPNVFNANAFLDMITGLAEGPAVDPGDEVDISLRPQMRASTRPAARDGRRARR
ncbi:hypothetical protein PMIN06_005760 [Paraphaeosphaeria minitans]